jgi:hypothetical protein
MREILPGIFTWGSTYADRPWDLNGYAIMLEGCTVLVDPPAPAEDIKVLVTEGESRAM